MNKPVIHVLDTVTANKIAAGEVVDRPASVVKELIENSLDAAATAITVEVAEGGLQLIRVTDNGYGMCPIDAETAIKRHATSKISSIQDVYRINTLGFRGEALPSIAAVSRFTLLTRQQESPLAFYVTVEGGKVTDKGEAGGAVGTVVTVADLFYNTPARRKFLKSPTAESSHIHAVAVKAALSHPGTAFKLFNNQRLVIQTPGQGNLLETIACLYGETVRQALLPVTGETDGVRVSGYISKPAVLRGSRQYQTFIVNGRVVNNRFLTKALDEAYHSLLPRGGFPIAVINLMIDAGAIDVNVHPQKSEVKFSNEKAIFAAVYRAVKEALASPAVPAGYSATLSPPASPPVPYYEPKAEKRTVAGVCELSLTYGEENPRTEVATTMDNASPSLKGKVADGLQLLGQIDDTYIVARNADGLYIFDQHAAHERIIYDHLRTHQERVPVQELLVPLYLSFDAYESDLLREKVAMLLELGIELTETGPGTFRLTGLPVDISPQESEPLIREIVSEIKGQATTQAVRETVLRITACRAAVKAGQRLSVPEMQSLLAALNTTALPYTCPHGRPTVLYLGASDLAKYFKRT